jgi:hypothetical protein
VDILEHTKRRLDRDGHIIASSMHFCQTIIFVVVGAHLNTCGLHLKTGGMTDVMDCCWLISPLLELSDASDRVKRSVGVIIPTSLSFPDRFSACGTLGASMASRYIRPIT